MGTLGPHFFHVIGFIHFKVQGKMSIFFHLRRLNILIFALISFCLLTNAIAQSSDFATNGELRMGLYLGSPSSVLINPKTNEISGIGYELGREFSKLLKVNYKSIIYSKNADVLSAARDQRVDLVFTNATPERAKVLQFSKTVVRIERGFLVSTQGKIQTASQIDQPGVKVGVSTGSTSELELTKLYKNAVIVTTRSTTAALELLRNGQLDAFFTNKGILFEMADQWDQAKVLDEVLGYESMALGVPMTRALDTEFLDDFIENLKKSGELQAIIKRSGLRGYAQE